MNEIRIKTCDVNNKAIDSYSSKDTSSNDNNYILKNHDGCFNKILADPFYSDVLLTYKDLKKVYEAGYFEDGLNPDALKYLMDPLWFTTPLIKITRNIQKIIETKDLNKSHRSLVVLLTTGAFAPIHTGHFQMMQIARNKLINCGYEVIGGFFSLSHDTYVLEKIKESRYYTAEKRVENLRHLVSTSDWLDVDPWESLYVPCAINFTHVIQRLENYLHVNIPSHPIKVAYVFGSDNARFTRTFCNRGMSICIARPGSVDKLEKIKNEAKVMPNPNLFFSNSLESKEVGIDISSSEIRQNIFNSTSGYGKTEEKLTYNTSHTKKPPKIINYFIRDDLAWSTSLWAHRSNDMELKVAIKKFLKNLAKALSDIFKTTTDPSFPKNVNVIFLSAKRQQQFIKKLARRHPIINLDKVTAGIGISLEVSRLFAISDAQFHPLSIIGELYSGQFSAQLSNINPGTYYLVDDDISTGSTMNKIENILPKGIKILKRISLADIDYKYQEKIAKKYPLWDLVDARDFLLGGRASGLLVEMFNGDYARAPYLPPFVNIITRLSLPPASVKQFSHTVLKINREFFNSLPFQIKIKDIDDGFKKLLTYMGFDAEHTMTEVIDWWERHLIPNA